MISIVVPAVWGHEPFCDFLLNVVELPVVGEVIIINNNVARTPDHKVLSHYKVDLLNQKENIFVNPAWNLGVSAAKFNTVCILNDDVLVDLRVFFEADKFVSKEIGMLSIGLKSDIYRLHNEFFDSLNLSNLIINGDIKIIGFNKAPEISGSGSLFFIHKDNWIDIPEELKIYWGDTWQFEMQMALGRTNYFINNCFYYSPWSKAAKIGVGAEYQQTNEFKKFENREYMEILKQNKLKELIGDSNGR